MSKYDIPTLLTCDSRFVRSGAVLQQTAFNLSELFTQPAVVDMLIESITALKHASRFLNILLYANSRGDSFVSENFSEDFIISVLNGTATLTEYEDVYDRDLQAYLGSQYINYKDIEISTTAQSKKAKFINELFNQDTEDAPVVSLNNGNLSTEYWVESVSLDFPTIPQPDCSNIVFLEYFNSQKYCIYGESHLPATQSEITAVTDVNQFSDADILKLYPPIRLYTRSPYMYKEYPGLELDDDLGIIFKIKGYNKRQIKKNIIEYPHLMFLDRVVRVKGKETTIPFWKHIEIDGEILSTASVWKDLPDTKNLPQTESFMNEYVVRKYLLERDSGIEHKYPMRGTLDPFLTLYNSPLYYENLHYDPIEIGRKCVAARQSFKRSRNPIFNMMLAGD